MVKNKVPIAKSSEPALMQALYVVLEPEVPDAHEDIYDHNEVRKACHNFNQSHATANLFHLIETDGFHVAESYVTPVEMILGEEVIKAGTWLVNLQFTDEDLWTANTEGQFSGVSISALGYRKDIDE